MSSSRAKGLINISVCQIVLCTTSRFRKKIMFIYGRYVSPFLKDTKALRVNRGIALLFSRTSALYGVGDQPHSPAASTP